MNILFYGLSIHLIPLYKTGNDVPVGRVFFLSPVKDFPSQTQSINKWLGQTRSWQSLDGRTRAKRPLLICSLANHLSMQAKQYHVQGETTKNKLI